MPDRTNSATAHLYPTKEHGLSRFRFYSVGKVAANKQLTSDTIEVSPIEDLPFSDGEITDHLNEESVTGTDSSGASFTATAKTSVTLSAKWLRVGDNRLTPPDVRRGETVMIYQYADADKFYWTTLLTDSKLRRLETVVYGWSASPTEDDPADMDHMYYLEISTHKKLITFHTSKTNGEPFAYDIQLNTKDGYLLVQDDIGNNFSIDSQQHRVQMTNTEGSHYDMFKKDLTITTPDTIKLISTKITINASDSVDVIGSNTVSVSTAKLTQTASGDMSSSAGKMTSTSSGQMSQSSGGQMTINGGGPVLVSSGASATIMSPATALI